MSFLTCIGLRNFESFATEDLYLSLSAMSAVIEPSDGEPGRHLID